MGSLRPIKQEKTALDLHMDLSNRMTPKSGVGFPLLLIALLVVGLLGCTGKAGMAGGDRYGRGTARIEGVVAEKPATDQADQPAAVTDSSAVADAAESDEADDAAGEMSGTSGKQIEKAKPVVDQPAVMTPERSTTRHRQFFGHADVDDSASAVDDEIWRQFDLAEEYHAMGVIANREGSWEEAQYYFEKSLKILASLDIESDSLETPEAAKYSIIPVSYTHLRAHET